MKADASLPCGLAPLSFGQIVSGDARTLISRIGRHTIDLSFFSPPYHLGKSYERGQSFEDWQELLRDVIAKHHRIIKPGGFMAVNIADILCFRDTSMPRFQADNIRRKSSPVTTDSIMAFQSETPGANRRQIAAALGCSEQTVQRRLQGNNARGGKRDVGTKVQLTGHMLNAWAEETGFYLYDQRIWHKDPCWENSRWHSSSYRAVDEFEHVYIFWKPGVTEYDRDRIAAEEWAEWGSRGVWHIPSVRRNDRHEAEFPEALAERVIRLFSPAGGTVIDPFAGSGSTVVAAERHGRQWIGFEIDHRCAELARSRLAQFRLRSPSSARPVLASPL